MQIPKKVYYSEIQETERSSTSNLATSAKMANPKMEMKPVDTTSTALTTPKWYSSTTSREESINNIPNTIIQYYHYNEGFWGFGVLG